MGMLSAPNPGCHNVRAIPVWSLNVKPILLFGALALASPLAFWRLRRGWPAGEAEASREDERRHERRGAVARLLQPLGEERRRGRHGARVLVDAVAGRVEAAQERRVGRQRLRHRGVGVAEAPAPRGKRVERGRLHALRLRPDRVRPRRVERDEQDRRPLGRRGRRPRRRPRLAPAGGEPERGGDDQDAVTVSADHGGRPDSMRLPSTVADGGILSPAIPLPAEPCGEVLEWLNRADC